MDAVVHGLDGIFVYLNDVLVASLSPEEHESHLCKIFVRLQRNGLIVRPEKRLFGQSELSFLGHSMNSTGIKPLVSCTTAILDFPWPSNNREL